MSHSGQLVSYGGQIGSAFTDKLVCAARPGATDKINKWAEQHLKVGDFVEHAGGSNHKVNPLHKVGTWEAISTPGSKNDVVRYNYRTGDTYSWSVWQQKITGSPGSAPVIYHFCDGATLVASGTTQNLPAASAPNPCGY